MYADANVSKPADSRILKNYSLDDLDIESLQQYRRIFSTAIRKMDRSALYSKHRGVLKKEISMRNSFRLITI